MRELARTKWKWIEDLLGVAQSVGDSFSVVPCKEQESNALLREDTIKSQYALHLSFDFWSKYPVEVRNVDARYEASGMLVETKTAFDNQEVPLNSVTSRFSRSRELEANSTTSIQIRRVFCCELVRNHGIARVDLELSGQLWKGVHVLHIVGRLGPRGVWEDVSLTFSHLSGAATRWAGGLDVPKLMFRWRERRVPVSIWLVSGSLLVAAFILGLQASRISIVEEIASLEIEQRFEDRVEELVTRHKLRQGQAFGAPDGIFGVTFTNFGWGNTACFQTDLPVQGVFVGDCIEVGQRFVRFIGSSEYTVTLVDRTLDMADEELNHVWIQVVKRSAPPS